MRFRHKPLIAALALSVAGAASAADLIEVYDLARQNDPSLAAAEAQSLALGQVVPIARAALLPQVSGNIGVTERRNSSDYGDGSSDSVDGRSRTWNLRLDQSLFDWGNYTNLGAARAQRAQAQADYEAAVDGLLLRVSETYFSVLTAEDALAFAEAEERAVGRQLEQAEQRFEVGLTAVTDVHEARARHDSARAAVINARFALDDAREALAEITGTAHGELKALRLNIPLDGPQPDSLLEWEEAAVQASPALASRRFALEVAQKNIGTARSAHLPSLGGTVTYGDTHRMSGSLPVTPNTVLDGRDTVIGVTLSVPIFAGFATQARVRQAVYQRDAAEDLLEAQRRLLQRQTRNDFRAIGAGISSVEARRQALLSAQSALEATQAGFEVGTRTIVDVLLSQQLLFQAQRDYSNARHQFILSGLRLKHTAGVIDYDDLAAVNALLTSERLSPEEIGARVAAEANDSGNR